MIFFLVFGIAMLLPGGFCTVLAILGRNPANLISTTGELTKRTHYQNYQIKNGTVPNAAAYTYTYTANGKPYQLRGVRHTHPRNLPRRVPIIYLRSFPRCAYQDHFSGIAEGLSGISLLAVSIFCITLYFAAV